MRGKVNMTGVDESGNFELLIEGTYIFNVDQVEDRVTKNGDPMILVTFSIINGEFAGRKVWDNIIFPEPNSSAIKIKGKTKHFLHCIGMPYEGEFDWDSEDWVNARAKIRVHHELYNGKPIAKVAEYILDEEIDKVRSQVEKIPF